MRGCLHSLAIATTLCGGWMAALTVIRRANRVSVCAALPFARLHAKLPVLQVVCLGSREHLAGSNIDSLGLHWNEDLQSARASGREDHRRLAHQISRVRMFIWNVFL